MDHKKFYSPLFLSLKAGWQRHRPPNINHGTQSVLQVLGWATARHGKTKSNRQLVPKFPARRSSILIKRCLLPAKNRRPVCVGVCSGSVPREREAVFRKGRRWRHVRTNVIQHITNPERLTKKANSTIIFLSLSLSIYILYIYIYIYIYVYIQYIPVIYIYWFSLPVFVLTPLPSIESGLFSKSSGQAMARIGLFPTVIVLLVYIFLIIILNNFRFYSWDEDFGGKLVRKRNVWIHGGTRAGDVRLRMQNMQLVLWVPLERITLTTFRYLTDTSDGP